MSQQIHDYEYFYKYLESVGMRFQRMCDAGVDLKGLPAFESMLEDFVKNKWMSPSEFKYLFDRTHPKGRFPKYNKLAGGHKRYGNMLECPVKYIAETQVNWRLPRDNEFVTMLQDDFDCQIPDRWGRLPTRWDTTLFK